MGGTKPLNHKTKFNFYRSTLIFEEKIISIFMDLQIVLFLSPPPPAPNHQDMDKYFLI